MYVLIEYLPLKKPLENASTVDYIKQVIIKVSVRDNGLGVEREWCNKKFDVYQNVGVKKKGAWTKVWA